MTSVTNRMDQRLMCAGENAYGEAGCDNPAICPPEGAYNDAFIEVEVDWYEKKEEFFIRNNN